jgi:hypothetical protein
MNEPFDWSSFVEVPGFLARWQACGCDDADLRRLQLDLLMDPAGWPVVPTAGGWRKARFAPPSWGKGKSGAVRVYYADLPAFGLILLGTAFTKAMAHDLDAKDKKTLATLLTAYRRRLQEESE